MSGRFDRQKGASDILRQQMVVNHLQSIEDAKQKLALMRQPQQPEIPGLDQLLLRTLRGEPGYSRPQLQGPAIPAPSVPLSAAPNQLPLFVQEVIYKTAQGPIRNTATGQDFAGGIFDKVNQRDYQAGYEKGQDDELITNLILLSLGLGGGAAVQELLDEDPEPRQLNR